jgi:hypothetical protein
MNEVLSIAEIEARYQGEWILLLDPQTDQNKHVLGGTLICHSKDRDEVYRQALELPAPKHIAVRYIGSVPGPGEAIIL